MDNTEDSASKPRCLTGDLAGIRETALEPLTAHRLWMMFRLTMRETPKGVKWTKPPYQTNGRLARTDDPGTWSTFDECLAAYQGGGWDGIGLVITGDIAAFDVDDCRDPESGQIEPWAERLVDRAKSYAEVTPSGSGIRILGTASGASTHTKRPVPGTPITVETYRSLGAGSARYITVTGLRLDWAPDRLADLDSIIDEIAAEIQQPAGPEQGINRGNNVVDLAAAQRRRGRPTRDETERRSLADIVENGRYEKFGNDRSRAVYWVVNEMVRRGSSDDEIVAALLNQENRIGDHVRDQDRPEQYARRQIGRARETIQGRLSEFVAFLPDHDYIHAIDNVHWPAPSVNVKVGPVPGTNGPMRASDWLDHNRAVDGVTWAPGQPQIIRDRIMIEGGWIDAPGKAQWNLYRPPQRKRIAGDVSVWRNHLVSLYGEEAAQRVERYFAHRVQSPGDKPNFALVLGGAPGIGKDTVIEPLKEAVGISNFGNIHPPDILSPWTWFLKSVCLLVSEASDLGEFDRFKFYEAMKTIIAAPPHTHQINEKHIRQYYVPNLCGVIITTNHRTGGLYLTPDDRRHEVYWSDKTAADFPDNCQGLWDWYYAGGFERVAHYLENLDLSAYSVKAPPPKTTAFKDMAFAGLPVENLELADTIEQMGSPEALTIDDVKRVADDSLRQWLEDRRNTRMMSHRLEECGYRRFWNPNSKDGSFVVEGRKRIVFVRAGLDLNAGAAAVRRLQDGRTDPPF